ncbi:MAG: hypothetical protein C4539_20245 [Ignavibacteriales bacterium]|nr:MAG: hypothetical protein C4539_20245 [Ignavibacteriales bacterium]
MRKIFNNIFSFHSGNRIYFCRKNYSMENKLIAKTQSHKAGLVMFALAAFIISYADLFAQTPLPVVSKELRGRVDAERVGTHDANKIRTVFYNYGMVGDYPADPINVDLSVFHSVEVPKGSGENYSDGTTPFVLAKVKQRNNRDAIIMETGYRERQGTSPWENRVMRFEPRPGYFQPDPAINQGRSVAMSNDSRTWPDEWIDKLDDPDDPGWSGYWNGYFGKAAGADQESFVVYDDDFYDAWNYYPDTRDETRRGLGLRVEQRGFQWSNPQAGNVIFFHYDISNESTTEYDDNILFGLYMDSGVGGSSIGQDGVAESDDDNAYFDKSIGLNLVYTWDKNNHGVKGTTGYLGYSYLETPGNQFDLKDNDDDGVTDEKRDGGSGEKIVGQDQIRAYVNANYNLVNFESYIGPLDQRPAFVRGEWFTGDEDMDWIAEFHDTGADGIFETNDTGENDGIPTEGEPYFDKTDIDESDQIGLTGFKMNRIKAGIGAPTTQVDNIVFFDDGKEWPKRLYNIFTNPDSSFDIPLVQNYNIGFLFASGTFKLQIGKRERFSLALGFGKDLRELRSTIKVVQQIYKANYQFAVPPPLPTLNAFAGDGYIRLNWDDAAERAYDPITNQNDFEGYRIYRSTDPVFLDAQEVDFIDGTASIVNGKPIAQFDLVNNILGYTKTAVEGNAYFLGEDKGLTHTYKDTTVVNGQLYYYAVCAYDRGVDSIEIYPSENAITVSQTLRGGTILPSNVVAVYPGRQVLGYEPAEANKVEHFEGAGYGNVSVQVLNSELVPDNHQFIIDFVNPTDSVHAQAYRLIDETSSDTIFIYGSDFEGAGIGPVGSGLLPVVSTPYTVQIDTANTGFTSSSKTNINFSVRYASTTLPIGLRRPGYPDNLELIFSDQFLDTTLAAIGLPKKPAKIKVLAHGEEGDRQLDYRLYDPDNNATLSKSGEYIEVVTYSNANPTVAKTTWVITVDTTGQYMVGPIVPPTTGDNFNLKLKIPFDSGDRFRFTTKGQVVNSAKVKSDSEDKPYVVPNPYVGAASFEPQRFAVSGRGERRMEFRNLPRRCSIRIFTINGELVKELNHDGNINKGYLSWDLRTKDNLEIAPGLYIFHVESSEIDSYIGKFAIIK